MRIREDERGVSVQIGAILLFAVLVVLLSTYQAYVVPQENEVVEFQHSQAVESDLQEVRNAILAAADSGAGRPEAVQLGVRYPARVFFVNPPPVTGTLETETVGEGTVTVANVNVTDDAETADFFEDRGYDLTYPTKALVYEGDYNVYGNAPIRVVEAGLLYNDYDNETVTSTQVLVRDQTITLVTLQGTYSKNGVEAASIDPELLSGPYNPIRVTNETAGNVTITLSTRLSAERWENRTSLGSQEHVLAVERAGDNQVRVVLEPDEYTFRVAKVGVGTDTTTPDAAYITRVGSGPVSTGEQVTFEVRDEYNNPVSGVEVSVNDSSLVSGDANRTTPGFGRVTYTYVGTGDDFNGTIGSGPERNVTVDGRQGTGGGGPGFQAALDWNESSMNDPAGPVNVSCPTNSYCRVILDGEPADVSLYAEFEQLRAFALVDFSAGDPAVVQSFDPTTDESDETGVVRTNATLSRDAATPIEDWLGETTVYAAAANTGEFPLTLDVAPDVTWAVDRIEGQSGGNVTDVSCTSSDCDVSVSGYPASVPLFGEFALDVGGRNATFASDNATVLAVSPGTNTSNASGVVRTTATLTENGTATVDLTDPDTGVTRSLSVTVQQDGEVGRPTLDWYVTDDTNTNNNTARYRISYEVSNVSSFSQVEATFENLNQSGMDDTATSTASSGTLVYDFRSGRGAGDTYNISLRAYNSSGSVVLQNSTVDMADNTDPQENASPPSGQNDPSIEGLRIDDLGQGSSPRYYVSYNVTNPQNLQNVEVEFRNLNASWPDQTNTSTSPRGGFSYEDTGVPTPSEYEIVVRVFNTNGTLVDKRTVEDRVNGADPIANDDLSEPTSPTLTSYDLADTTGSSGARYIVDYAVDDPAGLFDRTKVVFLNRDSAYATGETVRTSRNGSVYHESGGTAGDEYEIFLHVLDDDGVVVTEVAVGDVADGSVNGSDRSAVTSQVSNFNKNPSGDSFSVQAQGQDSDGDNDLVRLEYVVTNDSGEVVARTTRSGSGQQIQPGTITIQSDSDVQGGTTYTVWVLTYDEDDNYGWATGTA